MNFLPPLTENARKLLNHFRANLKSADYKVARRQQWHKLVAIIDELTGRVVKAEHEAAAYQYIATSLHLSATGQLTEALIETAPLTAAQKADCVNLARIYDRQRPRLMPGEPPAAGQIIVALLKPGAWQGKGVTRWCTGRTMDGMAGAVLLAIEGCGITVLDEVEQWLPLADDAA